jgi:carboxylesterase type B
MTSTCLAQRPPLAPGSLLCLESLTIQEMLTAQDQVALPVELQALKGQLTDLLAWAPQIDAQTVPVQPNEQEIGQPVIIGTNLDEGNLFITFPTVTPQLYTALLNGLFGMATATNIQALPRYAPVTGNNAQQAANVVNDYLFVCANRYVLRQTSGPAFSYQFARVPSFAVWPPPGAPQSCQPVAQGGEGKVCHSFELPYVFRNPVAVIIPATPNGLVPPGIQFVNAERQLINRITDYWASFAADDRPASPSAQRPWLPFRTNAVRQVLDLTLGRTRDTTLNCPFWDQVGYDLGTTTFDLGRRRSNGEPSSRQAAARMPPAPAQRSTRWALSRKQRRHGRTVRAVRHGINRHLPDGLGRARNSAPRPILGQQEGMSGG